MGKTCNGCGTKPIEMATVTMSAAAWELHEQRHSREDAKEQMLDKIGEMMENADPKEREALKECMRAIERA